MTRDEIRRAILDELENIAPETDAAGIAEDADLREALDIDSIDFLNFITGLHRRLSIDIPEKDYPRLFTIAGAIDYLNGARNPAGDHRS